MKTKEQIEDEIVEATIQSANNFGAVVDMFHPDYGQILKDGKPTEAGLDFFEDQLKDFKTPVKPGNA